MRVAIYDRVEPPVPAQLPLRLAQTCSQRAAIALLVLVVPAAFAGTFAALAVVFQALLAPDARAVVEQHPNSRPRNSIRHRLYPLSPGAADAPPRGATFNHAHGRDRRWARQCHGRRPFPLLDVGCTVGLVRRSCASRACIAVGHAPRADPRAPDARDECALECGAADITKRGGPRCDTSRPQRDSAQRTLSLQGPMAANDTSVFAGCRPCLDPPPSKNSTLSLATL